MVMLLSLDEKSLHFNTAFSNTNWFSSSANCGNISRYSSSCRTAVRVNTSYEARGMSYVFYEYQFSWVLTTEDIFASALHFEVQNDFLLLGIGIFLFVWPIILFWSCMLSRVGIRRSSHCRKTRIEKPFLLSSPKKSSVHHFRCLTLTTHMSTCLFPFN